MFFRDPEVDACNKSLVVYIGDVHGRMWPGLSVDVFSIEEATNQVLFKARGLHGYCIRNAIDGHAEPHLNSQGIGHLVEASVPVEEAFILAGIHRHYFLLQIRGHMGSPKIRNSKEQGARSKEK